MKISVGNSTMKIYNSFHLQLDVINVKDKRVSLLLAFDGEHNWFRTDPRHSLVGESLTNTQMKAKIDTCIGHLHRGIGGAPQRKYHNSFGVHFADSNSFIDVSFYHDDAVTIIHTTEDSKEVSAFMIMGDPQDLQIFFDGVKSGNLPFPYYSKQMRLIAGLK